MKKHSVTAVLAAIVVIALWAIAYGQPVTQGKQGQNLDAPCPWMYNPAEVKTIKGTVESVDRIASPRGKSYGVHLTVHTEAGPLAVHLGPGWFIEKQAVKIAKGDTIEATGMEITYDGKTALIADKVKKGDAELVLRNENGAPLWAGSRRPGGRRGGAAMAAGPCPMGGTCMMGYDGADYPCPMGGPRRMGGYGMGPGGQAPAGTANPDTPDTSTPGTAE